MAEIDDLKEALSAVELGVWRWDIVRGTIVWSDELCRLFGYGPGAAPPSYEAYLALVPPEERGPLNATIQAALDAAAQTKTSTSYVVEHRVVLEGGRERWIEGRGRVFVDAAGQPIRVTGTAVDVTARQQTSEQLRRSEEIHRIFGQLSSDYVYVADLLNPTLFPQIVAGSFERTIGMTPAEVQAKGGWWGVVLEEDHAALAALMPSLLAGKPSVNEYRIKDGLGRLRWLRDAVHPVTDPASGKVVKLMGGVQDITERKRLEEQLLQAQKLEAVARMAGGIAHDFNNLLAVVMGSVHLLSRELKSDSARESCRAIMEASQRGAELTRSLLVFARRDVGAPRIVNLCEVVREAVPMLARATGPRIEVQLAGADVPAYVHIDPGQAQLLLLNLAVNARDAMPEGGTIRISLRAQRFGAPEGLPSELTPGSYVRVDVADQGQGIAPEVMPRIFEPFFTTKGHGQGTGLGLAACQGIVAHAGGGIQVASAIGQGTTFAIYLPLAPAQAAQPAVSGAHHSPGGTERILLVEDERLLQGTLARSLRERGYTVLCADSGEAALELLERESFALLISDLGLPGIHGSELARQASARWPDLRVLCMSGYPGDASLPATTPRLPKPFTMDRLAHLVRATLDGSP